jgi:LRP1 type putative zinc finger protein
MIPSWLCQPYIRVLNPEAPSITKQPMNAIQCKACPNMSSPACPNVMCRGCCLKSVETTCETHVKRKKVKLEE